MSLIERTISIQFQHRIHFTKNVFGLGNPLLTSVLAGGGGQVPKVLVVLDESLHLSQPALAPQIESWFKRHAEAVKLVCAPLILDAHWALSAARPRRRFAAWPMSTPAFT